MSRQPSLPSLAEAWPSRPAVWLGLESKQASQPKLLRCLQMTAFVSGLFLLLITVSKDSNEKKTWCSIGE